jgi:DNA adenine methylase
LIEPFAGGAHIGLAAAIESLVGRVTLVEMDENVAAVWRSVLNDADWLIGRVQNLELNHESVEGLHDRRQESPRLRALATLVHNRISRGGIMADGAGVMNEGEDGKGLASRWYPSTLAERIQRIQRADGLDFVHGDGIEVMQQHAGRDDTALFVDPPYPGAGERLYTHSDVDHEQIFRCCAEAEVRCLITYDNSQEVRDLIDKYSFESEGITMSTTHHEEKRELLISRDLGWLRR